MTPRGRSAGSSSTALSRSAGGAVVPLVTGGGQAAGRDGGHRPGGPNTARALAVTMTVRPPGTSRTRRLTRTTAWTPEQSHITNSAPLASAISAARAEASFRVSNGPRSESRPPTGPRGGGGSGGSGGGGGGPGRRPPGRCWVCSGGRSTADAAMGVRAARAAMSAAVWAAERAPTSAPMSTATTPVIRISPERASPTRVAPPFSAAIPGRAGSLAPHPGQAAGPG